jgi:hypothetical protein
LRRTNSLAYYEKSYLTAVKSFITLVPEVVALHLEVKHFTLGVAGLRDEVLVEQRL